MNADLITHLRAVAEEKWGHEPDFDVEDCIEWEAADALEAAQAEADGLHAALNAMLTEWDALVAERDAEAALADSLAAALQEAFDGAWTDPVMDATLEALAAHRDRRAES